MDNPVVRICSHPRSGTHFLLNYLGRNFYPGRHDLDGIRGSFGHWSHREIIDPLPYGKLLVGHLPYSRIQEGSIYIYRDGRATALSVWKFKNFLHKQILDIEFTKFIRENIDWIGSPAYICAPIRGIFQHWYDHLSGWKRASEVFFVRYEDLVLEPEKVLEEIAVFYGLTRPEKWIRVDDLVGLSPQQGKIDSWKEYFTEEDEDLFFKFVPKDFYGVYNF